MRAGHDRLSLRTLWTLVNQNGTRRINTVKLRFIVRILQEMQVLDVEELTAERYQFAITFSTTKINLEKSSILRRLKSQCENRSH